MMISRRSVSECSGSSKIRARGSANTVIASSKETPCFNLICFGFLGIPFKLKRHPLEILSRCSSALSHGHHKNVDVHSQIPFLTELKMQAFSQFVNGATPETVAELIGRSRSLSDFRPHGKPGKTLVVQQLRKRLRHPLNPTRENSGSRMGTTLVPTPTRRRIKKTLSQGLRAHSGWSGFATPARAAKKD
jgi:hypothetical protein